MQAVSQQVKNALRRISTMQMMIPAVRLLPLAVLFTTADIILHPSESITDFLSEHGCTPADDDTL